MRENLRDSNLYFPLVNYYSYLTKGFEFPLCRLRSDLVCLCDLPAINLFYICVEVLLLLWKALQRVCTQSQTD